MPHSCFAIDICIITNLLLNMIQICVNMIQTCVTFLYDFYRVSIRVRVTGTVIGLSSRLLSVSIT
jgi:hypothetical protein